MPAALAGMLTWFLAALPAVAQVWPERVVIVLDASAAMQANLGNETKMDAAKNALGLLLQRYDGRLELGLAAFGSKKAKACADVAVLSPPQPLKAATLARTIASLKPIGAAPLGQALGAAVTALEQLEPKTGFSSSQEAWMAAKPIRAPSPDRQRQSSRSGSMSWRSAAPTRT